MKVKLSVGARQILLAAAVVLGFLLIPTPASADDSTCPAGNACFWTLQHFQGTKQIAGNQWEGQWVWVDAAHRNYHSVKNRFTNRAVLTAKPNQQVFCTPAGGNRETAPEFSVILVGGQGSHC